MLLDRSRKIGCEREAIVAISSGWLSGGIGGGGDADADVDWDVD